MNKIDRRRNYYIVIDTETTPFDRTLETVDPLNQLVYDIGFTVTDRNGTIYETYSYIVAETWINYRQLMKSAYYADKLPQYYESLRKGERKLASIMTIRQTVANLIKKYDVKAVVAHNMSFDLTALNRTIRYLTQSKIRYFFPYGVEIYDTLKMARSTLGKQKSYKSWCETHGYVTKNNRPKFTAEVLYIYLTHKADFKERHTALADAIIETYIFSYCTTRHTKGIQRKLYA